MKKVSPKFGAHGSVTQAQQKQYEEQLGSGISAQGIRYATGGTPSSSTQEATTIPVVPKQTTSLQEVATPTSKPVTQSVRPQPINAFQNFQRLAQKSSAQQTTSPTTPAAQQTEQRTPTITQRVATAVVGASPIGQTVRTAQALVKADKFATPLIQRGGQILFSEEKASSVPSLGISPLSTSRVPTIQLATTIVKAIDRKSEPQQSDNHISTEEPKFISVAKKLSAGYEKAGLGVKQEIISIPHFITQYPKTSLLIAGSTVIDGTGIVAGAVKYGQSGLGVVGGLQSLTNIPKEIQLGKSPATAITKGATGAVLGFSATGSVVKEINPFKITTFEVPTVKGLETRYKGLSVEVGTRGQAIIGKADGKVVVGTPKVNLEGTKPFIPITLTLETPTQLSIIKKNLPAKQQEQIGLGMNVMRATEKTKSRYVAEQFIKETKTLEPAQIQEVLIKSKEADALVYGSFPARSQVPEEFGRVPGDIDIQLKGTEAEAVKFASELTAKLQITKGREVRVNPKKATLIESKGIEGTDKEWVHAVDIHFKGEVSEEALLVSQVGKGEKAFGLKLGQKPIKIEDVNVMPLSEQGIRKGRSIFTPREGTEGFVLAPESHRTKDIPDFFTTQEVLLKSKFFKSRKAEASLEKLRSFYPSDLLKQTEPTKVLIAGGKEPPIKDVSLSRTITSPGIFGAGTKAKTDYSPSLIKDYQSSSSIKASNFKSPSTSLGSIDRRSVSPGIRSPSKPVSPPYRSLPSPPTYRSPPSPPTYRSPPSPPTYRSPPPRSPPSPPTYRSPPSPPTIRSPPTITPPRIDIDFKQPKTRKKVLQRIDRKDRTYQPSATLRAWVGNIKLKGKVPSSDTVFSGLGTRGMVNYRKAPRGGRHKWK